MQEIINAVVIDNEPKDILGVSTALALKGISTIPVHYKAAADAFKACEGAAQGAPRIIITDIQMREGGAEPSRTDLGNVTQCLAKIITNLSGPYVILAWTSIPASFEILKNYVEAYFARKNIALPLYFDSICKNECKPDGENYCADTIFKKFDAHMDSHKQIRALMHWEYSVFRSASETVAALSSATVSAGENLENILYSLAEGVAGRNTKGFESTAINEALSYVLKDKIGQYTLNNDAQTLWREAIKNGNKSISDATKHTLNTLLHIEKNTQDMIICPGDLWAMNDAEIVFKFLTPSADAKSQIDRLKQELISCDDALYKLEQQIAQTKNISYKTRLKKRLEKEYTAPIKNLKKEMQLVLVEISPACDFSNRKKPLKTLVIGAIIPAHLLNEHVGIKQSDSICSCAINIDDKQVYVAVSAKYIVSLSEQLLKSPTTKLKKTVRIRESLLQSWIHKIASYNSRIGTVSFH